MRIHEITENATAGATASGAVAAAPVGGDVGVAYAGAPYGVGTQPKKKKKTKENLEDIILRR